MNFAVKAALLCVSALPFLGVAPAQPGLAPLLARMRAANPGLFNAHIVSTSRHIVDGAPAILTTHVQQLRYRQDQCTGAVCVGTYFDGTRLFAVNINDTALPKSVAPEPGIRALRNVAMLPYLEPGFAANGGMIYDGGFVTFMGKRLHRIYVNDPIALPMKIYVDQTTGLIAGAQDVNGDATFTMHDYRRVGRFMLPFEIDRNGSPLEIYLTRRVESSPLGTPEGLSESLDPKGASMALDPQSISPLGTCVLAGVSVRCLIDSGNSAMSMSLELAEQLGLKPMGMLRVAGLGNYATEVVHAGPLQMGGAHFGPANYVVLSDIHRYGYDLVVGADVLAGAPVTMDYHAHEVYFGTFPGGSSAADAVPIAFENFIPVVNVTLGAQQSALAVDTGDQSNINLGYAYYQEHPELFQAVKIANVSGIGGDSVEMIGEIGIVRIGTITTQNQQIGTTKTLRGTADGHLGAAFLSKFKVVLDYAHEVMLLFPSDIPAH